MRYRLLRFSALIAAPYFYFRKYLAGNQMRPSDYFLGLLSKKSGRRTQAILFVIVLSIAARSFDAVMALTATKSLKSPIPLWALSIRDIRLLLEAPLWLESASQFDVVREEVLRQSDSLSRVRSILSFYESFARNEAEVTDAIRSQLVLPGLFWDRVAVNSFSDGKVRESADALHQALRFVPEGDPRRAGLVARFFQTEAILHGKHGSE
jgi:hypothetical protein